MDIVDTLGFKRIESAHYELYIVKVVSCPFFEDTPVTVITHAFKDLDTASYVENLLKHHKKTFGCNVWWYYTVMKKEICVFDGTHFHSLTGKEYSNESIHNLARNLNDALLPYEKMRIILNAYNEKPRQKRDFGTKLLSCFTCGFTDPIY